MIILWYMLTACMCTETFRFFKVDADSVDVCEYVSTLLLQDVESYDPILNPVLNREVRRTGGRVLITLGDQDIDLSPSFTIFLSTRDPSVSKH